MHSFSQIISRSSSFILSVLERVEIETLKELETSGATRHIQNMQMITLQKTIYFIGIFSYYESLLQGRLNCKNGFEEAKNILFQNSEHLLLEKFIELQTIVNVLKHGRGRSYNQILNKKDRVINIKIIENCETSDVEGDLADISSLIKVDNDFIDQSVEIINEVSSAIQKYKPDVFI